MVCYFMSLYVTFIELTIPLKAKISAIMPSTTLTWIGIVLISVFKHSSFFGFNLKQAGRGHLGPLSLVFVLALSFLTLLP